MSKLIGVKASVYNKHINCLNNRERFSKERQHLVEVYSLEKSLVDRVIDNMLNISTKNKNEIEANEETIPDYNFEKDMIYSYQDFKDELIYDGMFELSSLISLYDFYSLFSPYYCPAF